MKMLSLVREHKEYWEQYLQDEDLGKQAQRLYPLAKWIESWILEGSPQGSEIADKWYERTIVCQYTEERILCEIAIAYHSMKV